ncbi:MAG: hypothetical protein D6689_18425 [Deltaproteobacteria bacterium]|nr:MAG: hypothetical protein D6689_18425 [Deltaproteobacteria bacterium]
MALMYSKKMGRLSAVVALVTVAIGAPASADRRARTTVPPPRRPVIDLRRTAAAPGDQDPATALAEQLRAIWAGRALRRGTTAMYVVDAHTGEPLFAVHEDRPLNPASNVKLLSTATALHVLGPGWRYVTQLVGPAPDAAGTIAGDVYLYGAGDPTFGRRDLDRFAEELVALGIRRIDGGVAVSDLPIRDALAHPTLTVRVRGGAVGEPPIVDVEPALPIVEVVNAATTVRRRRRPPLSVSAEVVEAAGDARRLLVRVSGAVRPGHTRTARRRVSAGAWFTAHVLRAALVEAGIDVRGGVRTVDLDSYVAELAARGRLPIELARRATRPLGELIARVNKPSNNFLADRITATVGAARFGGPPSLDRGVDAMREWLRRAGVEPDEVVVDTGSGLSYNTRMSTRHIVRILRTAAGLRSALAPPAPEPAPIAGRLRAGGLIRPAASRGAKDDRAGAFVRSLAIAGVDGTLRRRYARSPLRGILRGKTGTLTSVIALAGLVEVGGREVAFAFVTNGHRHRRRNVVRFEHRRAAERILDFLRAAREAGGSGEPAPGAGGAVAAGDAAGANTTSPAASEAAAETADDDRAEDGGAAAETADDDRAENGGAEAETADEDGGAADGEANAPGAGADGAGADRADDGGAYAPDGRPHDAAAVDRRAADAARSAGPPRAVPQPSAAQ